MTRFNEQAMRALACLRASMERRSCALLPPWILKDKSPMRQECSFSGSRHGFLRNLTVRWIALITCCTIRSNVYDCLNFYLKAHADWRYNFRHGTFLAVLTLAVLKPLYPTQTLLETI